MSRLLFFSAVSHPENQDMAFLLFQHLTPQPNLFIYNTMISSLSSHSFLSLYRTSQPSLSFYKSCSLSHPLYKTYNPSLSLYKSMLLADIAPDKHTLLALLKASPCLSEVRQIHSHAIATGFFPSYPYLQNAFIKVYSDRQRVDLASQVFNQMHDSQDVVSWNSMIMGHARHGCPYKALWLFHDMGVAGIIADEFTLVGSLVACGRIEDASMGKSIHAWTICHWGPSNINMTMSNAFIDMYVKCGELGFAKRVFNGLMEKDIFSWNTMIAGYAKIGELGLALRLFYEMPSRDQVSWNSIIDGYAQKGNFGVVMELFVEMLAQNAVPDRATILSLVAAAGEAGALDQGRWVHGWVQRAHIDMDPFLCSALITMYCKCGSVEHAKKVFKLARERDVLIWTAMISGLAFHGYGTDALGLFSQMQNVGLKPNEVTFIGVLAACSHSGMVSEGLGLFADMSQLYGIEPGVAHYGCVVDLLGRAGMLKEASALIEKMPMKPSSSIWGTILSACRVHGEVEFAEVSMRELVKLEPEREGAYVLLSNVYSASQRWGEARRVREAMDRRGVRKVAGFSSIIVDGVVHNFIASDKRHPLSDEIYSVLLDISREMKSAVYVCGFQELWMETILE
ncbi:hypothetical protein AMTR_s00002p00267090 [Amborella trichopoda]|uniref:Pentatricopeptide repeat-containing protein n=2 Tax=Amborella trichopoda TaxID=13333 RepID=W1NUY4_AMBTC|nr:hypothetical protein AMTR_s00002p00267090 [Amborella trichopoda]